MQTVRSPGANDEAFTLARKGLIHTGDIDPRVEGERVIRLDPMPTARETAAVAELCDHLTAAEPTFPAPIGSCATRAIPATKTSH